MGNLDDVVAAAIHPAIGIARVGNSRREYYLGPEFPGRHPLDGADAHDPQSALKRQASRFRVFGLNGEGNVIAEITARDAAIEWTVHLANKKAAWYEFQQAFDIPASKGELPGIRPLSSALRNKEMVGADRGRLVIDPGPRTISGTNTNAGGGEQRYAFDSGRFLDKPVYLGELRTDPAGRLIVLGGYGESSSPAGTRIVDFANNPGWHDDIADGPVDALVRFGNRRISATGAWVIVGPPNFAPGVTSLVTGYDVVFEVATRLDASLAPVRPSFADHIQPLLERLTALQWVNAGFALQFGWGSPSDLSRAEMMDRLSLPGSADRPLRRSILSWFRDPTYARFQADRIPAIYGDAILIDPTTKDPREWMAILGIQYGWLKQWADGDFEPGIRPRGTAMEHMDAALQARALDRAALDDCAGGPFHPGIEFTWPLRQPMMFGAPLRLKRRNSPAFEPVPQLTSSAALAPGGPLDGSTAGDLTRWMALPWQTDTASCLSAYEDYAGEYLPTFWPARAPNDVIAESEYAAIMNRSLPLAEREAAFGIARRRKWLRGFIYHHEGTEPLPSSDDNLERFVRDWHTVGVVTRRPGPTDTDVLPDEVWVDTGRKEIGATTGRVADSLPAGAERPQTPFRLRRRSRLSR